MNPPPPPPPPIKTTLVTMYNPLHSYILAAVRYISILLMHTSARGPTTIVSQAVEQKVSGLWDYYLAL